MQGALLADRAKQEALESPEASRANDEKGGTITGLDESICR